MKRVIFAFYGMLAAMCWLACVLIMIFQPFLPSTNNRALIGFTIIGIVMTGIWLLMIYSNNPKPLNHGRQI